MTNRLSISAGAGARSNILENILPTLLMGLVILASNKLVLHPVKYTVFNIQLADILTWGAFTYPIAFLVTDTTNRVFGPQRARKTIYFGFALGVFLSLFDAIGIASFIAAQKGTDMMETLFHDPDAFAMLRVALASGIAFLTAQLLDVFIFNKLRQGAWWKAPVISSFISSIIDTFLFFTLAFVATGLPWLNWAMGDFVAKLVMIAVLIYPFKMLVALYPASLKIHNT